MHKYLILLSLFALSACTLGKTETPAPVAQTETPAPAPVTDPAPVAPTNPVVSLNYTLREGSPTGPILETTKLDVARANGLYVTGSTYTPFEVTLGTKSVIPGFEAGIATMKKGESKVIEVLPKDGYGEAVVTTTVQKGEVAPEFSVTTDITRFQDKITDTVQRSILGEQGTNVAVGQTLTGGANITAVVKKIDGDNITLEIDNKENPFYGKKLEVGAKASKDNTDFTITGLTSTGISLSIINRNSPFTGKPFVVGAVATLPATENGPSGEIKVLAINGDSVELSVPNTHPLAGKTLYFEVEVLDITESKSTMTNVSNQNPTMENSVRNPSSIYYDDTNTTEKIKVVCKNDNGCITNLLVAVNSLATWAGSYYSDRETMPKDLAELQTGEYYKLSNDHKATLEKYFTYRVVSLDGKISYELSPIK